MTEDNSDANSENDRFGSALGGRLFDKEGNEVLLVDGEIKVVPKSCSTYFVRHSGDLSLSSEEIRRLCDDDRIFIHYPGDGDEDIASIEPEAYLKPSAKTAISILNELASKGGFVWAQYRGVPYAKVGYVMPDSKIELVESTWESKQPGRKAILKTLRLDHYYVKRVAESELMHLRARRPRQGTILRWHAAGDAIERFVHDKLPSTAWNDLTVDQQECVCLEFLRDAHAELPQASRLLLPPGRTLKDIDIYATASDGKKIYAQVTNYDRMDAGSGAKIERLKHYLAKGNHVLYFCHCDEMKRHDGITFIPVAKVHEWLLNQPEYMHALYS